MSSISIVHISFTELSDVLCVQKQTLLDVIEYGIAEPVAGNSDHDWLFENSQVSVLKKALRLHNDLGVNWQGVAMILELLEQRDELLAENNRLQQRLGRFLLD